MQNLKTIYEDENVLVLDKPAGVNSDDFPKRAHRLDKDTSGVLLIAKDDKTLEFLQEQFRERKVEKKYMALVVGHLKNGEGKIETLLGRSPGDRRKQKAYLPNEPGVEKIHRKAITKYRVLQRFSAKGETSPAISERDGGNYELVEVEPKTGRKHQIRAHFVYLGHPIAGDKLYGFKNQPIPKDLARQFLHASYLKIKLPGGEEKEFFSELPEDLKKAISKLTNQPVHL